MPETLSGYKGSPNTAEAVREEIANRWGEVEAANYDASTNCMPFRRWSELGYRILKGEKSIRSRTLVEKKDEQGNVIRKYPKVVHLFYKLQVVKSDKS